MFVCLCVFFFFSNKSRATSNVMVKKDILSSALDMTKFAQCQSETCFQKCTFFKTAHHANLKHVSGWYMFQNDMQHVHRIIQAISILKDVINTITSENMRNDNFFTDNQNLWLITRFPDMVICWITLSFFLNLHTVLNSLWVSCTVVLCEK